MRKAVKIALTIFTCVVPALAGLLMFAASPASNRPAAGILAVGDVPGTHPISAGPRTQLRVVTYNIGYASGDQNNLGSVLKRATVVNNLNAIAAYLKSLKADVVALQEADFAAARSFEIDQLLEIALAAEFPYAAYIVTWNKRYVAWPYWPPSKHFGAVVSGQAILSRYPIVRQEVTTFPKPESNAFWYNWFYPDRVIQEVTIALPDGAAVFYHVHLEAFDERTRLAQARTLAKMVSEDKTPWRWALGDFNSVSFLRPALPQAERDRLEDSAKALNAFVDISGLQNAETATPFYTMSSWNAVKKIDHILYAPPWSMSSVTTAILTASDHLPVVADFVIAP